MCVRGLLALVVADDAVGGGESGSGGGDGVVRGGDVGGDLVFVDVLDCDMMIAVVATVVVVVVVFVVAVMLI